MLTFRNCQQPAIVTELFADTLNFFVVWETEKYSLLAKHHRFAAF